MGAKDSPASLSWRRGAIPDVSVIGREATGRLDRRRVEGSRIYWVAAATFAVTASLLFAWVLGEAVSAFGDGITAANPLATGTFTGSGIQYFQDAVTYTFVHGKGSYVGGGWSPVSWAVYFIAIILVGRLWRIGSTWRRRRATTTGTV